MGRLLQPKGLKGELRVRIFNEVDSALKVGMKVWLKLDDERYCNHIIECFSISGDKSWIKFMGCETREDADHLNGLYFSIPRNDFAPLSDKEFYLVDLIGCKILDENRNNIGLVVDTMSLPAQNLIVVERMGKEILIPFVAAHVLLFDKKENILIVRDVEGLLI